MTERIEEEDIRNAPIKWKVPGAGFVGEGGFVALIDRDPDPFPCVVHDGPEEEREAHERTCRETLGHRLGAGGRHAGRGQAGPGGVPLSGSRLPPERLPAPGRPAHGGRALAPRSRTDPLPGPHAGDSLSRAHRTHARKGDMTC